MKRDEQARSSSLRGDRSGVELICAVDHHPEGYQTIE
jgi:hypothetical protein